MKFTSSALLFSLFLSSPFFVHADDQPIASELDGLGPPPPTGFGGKYFHAADSFNICLGLESHFCIIILGCTIILRSTFPYVRWYEV